jgi:hypothetical protein
MRDNEKETRLANERLSKIYLIVKQDNHYKFIPFKPRAILGMTPPRCRQVKLPLPRQTCTEKGGFESYVLHIHGETRQAAGLPLRQELS